MKKSKRLQSKPAPSRKNQPPSKGPSHQNFDFKSFPIVGIGASAGGLEAFTRLLKRLPVNTGMAFVVVQHLDPKHESVLTELLSRETSMPVLEVSNNLPVVPNHVYVIPPNKSMGISQGTLRLGSRKQTTQPQNPIDQFLEALARDKHDYAIGVILSGTATDGTIGLEAIKNEGGITFAQDASAKYDSMPKSAIASGCVDFVLSPEKIGSELARIAKHPGMTPHHATALPAKKRAAELAIDEILPRPAQAGFSKILSLLLNHSGVDFSLYKTTTIQRRVTRRMVLNRQNTFEDYARLLRGNSRELSNLYSDLLINVTSFFRNPEAFEALKAEVFPELVRMQHDEPLRIWVPGCSTGQEVYSIAMAFTEFAEKSGHDRKLQFFATDLNEKMIEVGRAGYYSRNLVQNISPERLQRFFVEEDGGYRVAKFLRQMVVFARQNLINDPPFSRMDLISCRNLLIYLETNLQRKLLPIMHYSLKPGGFLLLGASESVGPFVDLFEPVDKKHKIFIKKPVPTPAHLRFTSHHPADKKATHAPKLPDEMTEFHTELSAQREADRLALDRYAPPGVLINASGQILQFRGKTSDFLNPPTGTPTFDLLKIAREGLMMPLRSALNQAKAKNTIVRKEGVQISHNGGKQMVSFEILPLRHLKDESYLISFELAGEKKLGRAVPVPGPANLRPLKPGEESRRTVQLERELAETRDYLKAIQEQAESANEELQASNEEITSANEELQSTNEELETSKEELESTNEELTTVNEEMVHRNAELNRLYDELNNFTASVRIAMLFFSRNLAIRKFTPQAQQIFNLVESDLGRPLGNIRHDLDVPDLEGLLLQVIKTGNEQAREVQDKAGRWYSLCALPYLTADKRIDGAVLTLVDINTLKRSELEIQRASDYAEAILRTARDPVVVLRADLRVNTANEAFYRTFHVSRAETEGCLIYELGHHSWNIPRLRELLENILPKNTSFNDFEVTHDFPKIGRRTMLLDARRLQTPEGAPAEILLGIEDVTEHQLHRALQLSELRFRTLAETLPQLLWIALPDGKCDYFNSRWSEYTGLPLDRLLGNQWEERIHPEDRERTREYRAAALKRKTSFDLEFRLARADGVFRWFKTGATPIHDAAGKVIKWFGACTDIEDQKQAQNVLEQKVAERTARLQEALMELETFSYSISHDMRAPLRAMVGFASLLLDEKLVPTAKDYLEQIVLAGNRLDRLIQDVLAYSRVSRAELRLAPVNLEKIIQNVIHQYGGLNTAKIQIQSPLLPVLGHEAALTQCVANLIGNAVKFVSPGKIPTLRIRTEPREESVRVWFEDDGIGIEPADLRRIFSMFERVNSPEQFDGTGIGLAIVRKAIERMGGIVGVESKPGKGSKFWIQLQGTKAHGKT